MPIYNGLELPASVISLIELSPLEDIMLAILREALPDINVYSLIPDLDRVPFIQVRRLPGMGYWQGDARFLDAGKIQINVFTKDPDGDQKGALISEAVRVAFRRAWRDNWYDPEMGSLVKLEMQNEPARKSDWATSSGPVQYADLPTGHWRYESAYGVRIRKPSES